MMSEVDLTFLTAVDRKWYCPIPSQSMDCSSDMPVVCIDMDACNFSDLSLINTTEIMSISLVTIKN